MFTTKITKLSRDSSAGVILLIAAFLLLSVTQARAQTGKARTTASSLADVTLEPKAKLIVILGTGEKIKGRADNIGDGTLSIKLNIDETATFPRQYKIRRFSESEIFQIYQVKGTSRGRGALYGALIGAVPAIVIANYLASDKMSTTAYTFAYLAITGPLFVAPGAVIGALVSGEKMGGLIFQNPAVSPPSWFKTGLLNFRDSRLSFAAPSIYLRPDNFDQFRVKPSKKITKHIELVRVDF